MQATKNKKWLLEIKDEKKGSGMLYDKQQLQQEIHEPFGCPPSKIPVEPSLQFQYWLLGPELHIIKVTSQTCDPSKKTNKSNILNKVYPNND